jgi:hypothetical protein
MRCSASRERSGERGGPVPRASALMSAWMSLRTSGNERPPCMRPATASARGGVDPDGGQNDAGGYRESERSVHSRIQVDHVAAGHRADELHLEKATPSKLAQHVPDRAAERDVACHGDRNTSLRLGSARRGVQLGGPSRERARFRQRRRAQRVPADELLEQPAVARELIRRLPKLRKIWSRGGRPRARASPLAARSASGRAQRPSGTARGGRYSRVRPGSRWWSKHHRPADSAVRTSTALSVARPPVSAEGTPTAMPRGKRLFLPARGVKCRPRIAHDSRIDPRRPPVRVPSRTRSASSVSIRYRPACGQRTPAM